MSWTWSLHLPSVVFQTHLYLNLFTVHCLYVFTYSCSYLSKGKHLFVCLFVIVITCCGLCTLRCEHQTCCLCYHFALVQRRLSPPNKTQKYLTFAGKYNTGHLLVSGFPTAARQCSSQAAHLVQHPVWWQPFHQSLIVGTAAGIE